MARITMEDDIESRPEHKRLVKILGNEDQALGMLSRFRRLAQDYWGQHELVPLEEIENWDFQPIVDCGWGILKEGGVEAKFSQELFGWYRQKCDASKKGVEARQNKTPGQPEPIPGQPELGVRSTETITVSAPVTPLALAPVPSLSPTQIQKKESKGANAVAPRRSSLHPGKTDPDIPKFVATYVKAYQTRYSEKTRPDLRGKTIGQIKNFLRDLPIDRACNLIQVFCQMDDPWFIKKHHDFGTFLENQNKVSYALDTGEEVNSIDWTKVFRGDDNEPARISKSN
jgi:hypothetical protein